VVVPTVYTLVAKNTHSPEYVSQLIEKLTKRQAGGAFVPLGNVVEGSKAQRSEP